MLKGAFHLLAHLLAMGETEFAFGKELTCSQQRGCSSWWLPLAAQIRNLHCVFRGVRFIVWKPLHAFLGHVFQVPNRVDMVYERMKRASLVKYKAENKKLSMYNTAAKLWSEGVSWEKAQRIVQQAFDACIADD